RTCIEQVRHTMPMEHLLDLSREIGFGEADQVSHNVKLNIPLLPFDEADVALCLVSRAGHEETRRRGTIQPHVKGVVVEDRRTRALQLLSVGNPSLLLTMCADYWDGSTISAIPAALKSAILDMYQQWSLVRDCSFHC
ncbi:hypothetical protein JKP88DRAFT_162887, partial [Tribonema minus]